MTKLGKNTNPKKRQWCKELFLQGYLPDEIVNMTGMSRATVFRYKRLDKWDEIAELASVTPTELANKFRTAANEIVVTAEKESRTLNSKEIDQITKLVSSISKVNPKSNYITIAFDAMKKFHRYLVKQGKDKYTTGKIAEMISTFLQEEFEANSKWQN